MGMTQKLRAAIVSAAVAFTAACGVSKDAEKNAAPDIAEEPATLMNAAACVAARQEMADTMREMTARQLDRTTPRTGLDRLVDQVAYEQKDRKLVENCGMDAAAIVQHNAARLSNRNP